MTDLDQRARTRVAGWSKRWWIGVAIAAALVLFADWAWLTRHDLLAPTLDVRTNAWFTDLATGRGWLVEAARGLSRLGLASIVVTATVVTAIVLYRRGVRWLAWWFVGVVAVGWALTQGLKLAVARGRPPTNGDLSFARGFSFPSGHASVGIYAFGGLAVVLVLTLRAHLRWWLSVPVALVGIAIGVSRLVLGVHWITDVVAGWALGLLVLSVAAALLPRIVSSRR
jgi:membrane-associated phospholipid phosphatase